MTFKKNYVKTMVNLLQIYVIFYVSFKLKTKRGCSKIVKQF